MEDETRKRKRVIELDLLTYRKTVRHELSPDAGWIVLNRRTGQGRMSIPPGEPYAEDELLRKVEDEQ